MWHSSELGIDAALGTGGEVHAIARTRRVVVPVQRFRTARRRPMATEAKLRATKVLPEPRSGSDSKSKEVTVPTVLQPILPPLRSKHYPRY
jgi:hypothetical protein